MPTITNPGTIEAIASEYCTNGRNKAEALISVGYSRSYAEKRCGGLYARTDLIAAINAYQAKTEANTAYTVTQAEQEYEDVRKAAYEAKQFATACSAITGKARLYGMDKDNQLVIDKPLEMDKAELEELNRMANLKLSREVG